VSFVPPRFSVSIAIFHCFVTFMPSSSTKTIKARLLLYTNDNMLLWLESKEMEKFVTECSESSLTTAEKRSKRKPKFHVKSVRLKTFPNKLVQGISLVSTLYRAECLRCQICLESVVSGQTSISDAQNPPILGSDRIKKDLLLHPC